MKEQMGWIPAMWGKYINKKSKEQEEKVFKPLLPDEFVQWDCEEYEKAGKHAKAVHDIYANQDYRTVALERLKKKEKKQI